MLRLFILLILLVRVVSPVFASGIEDVKEAVTEESRVDGIDDDIEDETLEEENGMSELSEDASDSLANDKEELVTDDDPDSQDVETDENTDKESKEETDTETEESPNIIDEEENSDVIEKEEAPDIVEEEINDMPETEEDTQVETDDEMIEEGQEDNNEIILEDADIKFEDEDAFSEEENQTFSIMADPAPTPAIYRNGNLTASNTTVNNQSRVSLTFTSSDALDLNSVRNSTIIFAVPRALMNNIQRKDASHRIAGVAGTTLTGGTKTYTDAEVKLDSANSQVYLNVNLTNLNLMLLGTYTFTVNLYYNTLPATSNGVYNFQAAAIAGSQVVPMSSITGSRPTASFSVVNPVIPPLIFSTTVYSTDSAVRGVGIAGNTARITIAGETFNTVIRPDGTFIVEIGARSPGTVIRGIQVKEDVLFSSEASTTVRQRPDVPILLEVHSQDTIVRGTAQPNMTVRLTIQGETFSGLTASDGTFSINILRPQSAGTQITAVAIDSQQHPSLPGGAVVLESGLRLLSVPQAMAFGTQQLGNLENMIPLPSVDWEILVLDTRSVGSKWKLDVQLAHPLRGENTSKELPGALVFIDNNNNMLPLSEEALTVYSSSSLLKNPVSVSWSKNKGPNLRMVDDVMADTYSTSMTWTLSDAP